MASVLLAAVSVPLSNAITCTLDKEFNVGNMLDQFEEIGVICPDDLLRGSAPRVSEVGSFWKNRMSNLKPGSVTEIYIHCADDSPEVKTFTNSQGIWSAEAELFSDPKTVNWIKDAGDYHYQLPAFM